ncbi:MAG: ABC transporter ATP-binding protein [Bacilli bacterium]
MKKLFHWIVPYIPLFLLVLLLTILAPITYSFVPQFFKYVIDIILGENPTSQVTLPTFLTNFYEQFTNVGTAIIVVAGTLILFQLLRASGLIFMNSFLKGILAEKMAYDMRTKLYNHIQNLSFAYHSNVDTGDLVQRCTSDVETIKMFMANQFPSLFFILGSFGGGIVQMAIINPTMMWVTLIVVPINLVMSVIYFQYIKRKFTLIEESEASMTTVLQENVNGVRVVKAFSNENYEIDKFDKQSRRYSEESVNFSNAMSVYWGVSDGLINLQYGITIITAIFLAKSSLVSVGDIMASLMYIGAIVYPIRNLGRIIKDMGRAIVASNRLEEILSIPNEYTTNGTLKPPITGHIEFRDVAFKFDDTEKHLLCGVNFTILQGETVAIIGKTGSGKSTIANLICRMLEYSSGSILLDGVELKDIDKKWVRSQVGILLQDPFLYAKSILENIRIADHQIPEDRIQNIAKVASVHDDIKNFKEGYNTLVGEKGVTLSGGQKQRLAIARMLVMNKPIMIFDDSLSAVDTKTDLNIRNALKRENKNLTSIIITHRITTAKEADKIIVLENGKVSAIGTHKELAHREGLYQSLWAIQGALEDEFIHLVKEEVKSL